MITETISLRINHGVGAERQLWISINHQHFNPASNQSRSLTQYQSDWIFIIGGLLFLTEGLPFFSPIKIWQWMLFNYLCLVDRTADGTRWWPLHPKYQLIIQIPSDYITERLISIVLLAALFQGVESCVNDSIIDNNLINRIETISSIIGWTRRATGAINRFPVVFTLVDD